MNNIKIFENDLPSNIDLSNEKVIGIDNEALGLVLGRDPLTLVQLGLESKQFYLIKLNRETYTAPNLVKVLSNPSTQFIMHYARQDLLWLKYAVKNLWEDNVRSVQKSDMQVNIKYALLSYIVIIIGVYLFVVKKTTNVKEGMIYGFIYGFILYAVFDFTNLAIFKDFSLKTAVIDMLWGGFLTSVAVGVTKYLS